MSIELGKKEARWGRRQCSNGSAAAASPFDFPSSAEIPEGSVGESAAELRDRAQTG